MDSNFRFRAKSDYDRGRRLVGCRSLYHFALELGSSALGQSGGRKYPQLPLRLRVIAACATSGGISRM